MATDPRRFRVLVAGRRWGKTRLGALLSVAEAAQGKRCWWLAPTYGMAMVGWREILALAYQFPEPAQAIVRRGDLRVVFPFSGGWVQVRSADDPDRLRGEGLDFVVFDEAALIDPRAWHEVIRPALADRRGRALFISTPRGRNWFWQLYQLAERRPDEWAAFHFPTNGNPFVPQSEIEMARQTLPDRVFRQEFLAEFVEDGGGVFRNVRTLARAELQTAPYDGHLYVVGVDWGKFEDYSVFVVLDVTARAVAEVVRINRVDYQVQLGTLSQLCRRFRPVMVLVERNAIGEPLLEQLLRQGLPVQPFAMTASSKLVLVDALALALEREELLLPAWPEAAWLLEELEAFTANRTPSGMLSYGAPPGMHDDGVIALGLANLAAGYATPPRYGPTIWG